MEFAVVLAFLALLIALVIPAPRVHGFFERVYEDSSGFETPYVLFVPHHYRGDQPYPVLFFLHGWGDAYRVTRVGLGPAFRKREKTFPFFCVFPQVQVPWDKDCEETRRAVKVLDQVQREYNIDKKRIYLSGLSNGGSGVWQLAAQYPERWAAIVPLGGAGYPELAPRIKHIPCWCFHGDADTSIHVDKARAMIEALRSAGAHPRYTELKGFDHNVWDEAYNMPELYDWLLEQRLP